MPQPVVVDPETRQVDYSVIRMNQAFMICGLILAFFTNMWQLVALVSAVMLVGAIVPSLGLPKILYTQVLKPIGMVKSDIRRDNPEPHRFAQGVGGTAALITTLTLLSGLTVWGWAMCWLVVFLASLNLVAGFCVGVRLYYWLQHRGVPGFTQVPLKR